MATDDRDNVRRFLAAHLVLMSLVSAVVAGLLCGQIDGVEPAIAVAVGAAFAPFFAALCHPRGIVTRIFGPPEEGDINTGAAVLVIAVVWGVVAVGVLLRTR